MPDDQPTWPELHARIDTVRERWRAATAGLSGNERPPDAPNDTSDGTSEEVAAEESWGAAQIYSHVANALQLYADALGQVAVSGEAAFAPPQRVLKGHHPYTRIRDIGEKGWTDFRGAAVVVAKQPERGSVIAFHAERLDAREFLARTLSHLDSHTEQIRALAATD